MNLDDLIDFNLKEPRIGSEDSAWATLRKKFVERGCDIQRFEDKLSKGIPDSNICAPGGKEFWFEGKFLPKYPARQSTPVRVGLRLEQCNWLITRARHGARCFVWVREPDGWRLISSEFEKVRDGVPLKDWAAFGTRHATAEALVEALLASL